MITGCRRCVSFGLDRGASFSFRGASLSNVCFACLFMLSGLSLLAYRSISVFGILCSTSRFVCGLFRFSSLHIFLLQARKSYLDLQLCRIAYICGKSIALLQCFLHYVDSAESHLYIAQSKSAHSVKERTARFTLVSQRVVTLD